MPMQPGGGSPHDKMKPQQAKPNTALGTTAGMLKPVQAAAGLKPILPIKPKNTTGKYGPQPMGQQKVAKGLKAYKAPNPFKVGVGRAKTKAKIKTHNVTSTPGGRGPKGQDGKFGTPKPKPTPTDLDSELGAMADDAARPGLRMVGAGYGLMAGSAAGSAVGAHRGKKKYPDSKVKIGKASKFQLITDVGTKAGKEAPRWPELPKKSIAGGIAAGAYLGHADGVNQKRLQAKKVQAHRRRQAKLQMSPVTKSLAVSAFGVDHG